MAERILPQVKGDSYLDKEIALDEKGNFRLTVMGIMHFIGHEGRPRYKVPITDEEGNPDVQEVEVAASEMIRFVARSTMDQELAQGNDAKNPLVRDRIREYTAVVRGFSEHIREGGTPNLWQLPLLRFLGLMGYSSVEIHDAVYSLYPPEDPNISPGIKRAFRRAAMDVWGIGNNSTSLFGEEK